MGDTIDDLGPPACCICGDWACGVLYGFNDGMADGPGVRPYGEKVGVSSLRMCDEADGGGCGRPGGGLDVVLIPPRATSSTLFGAAGAGAGSSSLLSKKDKDEVFPAFGAAGAFDEEAATEGVGDGREGDAPYALALSK